LKEDNVCTAEVLAALDLLAAKATVKWPFEQFRDALIADKGTQEFDNEAKRRLLMA
jgi:DTW domain-containing protein YfiP